MCSTPAKRTDEFFLSFDICLVPNGCEATLHVSQLFLGGKEEHICYATRVQYNVRIFVSFSPIFGLQEISSSYILDVNSSPRNREEKALRYNVLNSVN